MRKLLLTILALSLLLVLLPAPGAIAGELPKVMGVTLGGAYDGLRDMYVNSGRTIAPYNDIPDRGVPASVGPEKFPLEKQHPYRDCDEFELSCFYRYGTTLVEVRGSNRTLYRVFGGRIYEIDIAFDVGMLEDHLRSLKNKYGEPVRKEGGAGSSEITEYYTWQGGDLGIEIKRPLQGPLSESFYLTYTYTPLERELEKAIEKAMGDRRKEEERHF